MSSEMFSIPPIFAGTAAKGGEPETTPEPTVELKLLKQQLNFDQNSIFFRCIQDSIQPIMISDRQGLILYTNLAWQKTYGYSSEETIGKSASLLHSGHQNADFYKKMWSAILDTDVGYWTGELINRAKDGTLIPVLLTITAYRGPDGQILGYMGTSVDLSHKQEIESKIIQQDRLASVGMLASGLAHEVGTPLSVIRGRAEFLMMQSPNALHSRNLEVIVLQIDRISKLIRALLQISRSSGDLKMEPISIYSVAQEVVALVEQHAKQDAIQPHLEVSPDLRVMGDFSRTEQVLLNLVMNSVQAIRKTIKDGRHGTHFLRIRASRRKGKVAIDIQDSGCGISPENMKNIFKPFFTTKDIGEGTGLGLPIVAQLLREMNGEIAVESVVNQTTTFTVLMDWAQ